MGISSDYSHCYKINPINYNHQFIFTRKHHQLSSNPNYFYYQQQSINISYVLYPLFCFPSVSKMHLAVLITMKIGEIGISSKLISFTKNMIQNSSIILYSISYFDVSIFYTFIFKPLLCRFPGFKFKGIIIKRSRHPSQPQDETYSQNFQKVQDFFNQSPQFILQVSRFQIFIMHFPILTVHELTQTMVLERMQVLLWRNEKARKTLGVVQLGIQLGILQNQKKQTKMRAQNYFIIDGIKVNANLPFIVRYDASRIQYQDRQQKSKFQNPFIDSFFFNRAIDDIQPIDYSMLRYGSVSSLRDYHLFAPPENSYKQPEQMTSHGKKKTIYMNQFTDFCYQHPLP